MIPFNIVICYSSVTKKSPRGEYELTDSIMYYINDGGVILQHSVEGLKDIGTLSVYTNVNSAE